MNGSSLLVASMFTDANDAAATRRVMPTKESLTETIRRYLQWRLREAYKTGARGDERRIADKAGLSPSALNQLRNKGHGGGSQMQEKLAQAFGIPPTELGRVAQAWADEHPIDVETIVETELDARYPNAVEASRIAREGGVDETGVESVLEEAANWPEDRPVLFWLDMMRGRAAALKRGAFPEAEEQVPPRGRR